jgi:transposase-like protein
VSRENIEAGERLLRELAERDFSEKDILIVYIDGMRFGPYHVIAAVGVDAEGYKHVLGLREGASENAEVAGALLEDLVERGVKLGRRRLFVIDGAKALRTAIDRVYGGHNPVQRCRKHKERNVLGHLPKDQHDQATATLRAAWKLGAKEGMQKIEQYAGWIEREWPSAAGSLREGLDEMFTINRLNLPGTLRRCLATTNLIDSTDSGVRHRTRRVTNWQHGKMALRWAAAGFVETEKNYRRIMGYQQLWMLKASLDEPLQDQELANQRKVG